jgi:hypothetical protein
MESGEYLNVKIYKYPLILADYNPVVMPKGSTILDLQIQNNTPTIWVLVDTNTKYAEVRTFAIFGTGQEIENVNRYKYIKTFQLNNFVWHVFEVD